MQEFRAWALPWDLAPKTGSPGGVGAHPHTARSAGFHFGASHPLRTNRTEIRTINGFARAADWEIGDTAGLETRATGGV